MTKEQKGTHQETDLLREILLKTLEGPMADSKVLPAFYPPTILGDLFTGPFQGLRHKQTFNLQGFVFPVYGFFVVAGSVVCFG